jgi:hypothetical protein
VSHLHALDRMGPSFPFFFNILRLGILTCGKGKRTGAEG